ncbi:HAD-superfamily hydrolase subfamily IA, variant 3 [Dichotomocladium elegans]|nr:HAD-superfamily hydrolase subfamily IA, variant 3 [Dichotomocladium elegans]
MLRARAFAFDLDGTLIDTTPLVEKHWRNFAMEHNLDPEKILATSHGRRTIETLSQWTPDNATQQAAEAFERKLAEQSEGVSILPGVQSLLDEISSQKWGICTAGNKHMATMRLTQVGLPVPSALVTGDTVSRGKPDPESYLALATKLGVEPKWCLVFEDAPAGVRSARAAGMNCVACTTTHTVDQLKEAGATYVVSHLTDVDISILSDGTYDVLVSNPL